MTTILPPSFTFDGDKKSAVTKKGSAINFSNFVIRQMEVGGINNIQKSTMFSDGSVIVVDALRNTIYNHIKPNIYIYSPTISKIIEQPTEVIFFAYIKYQRSDIGFPIVNYIFRTNVSIISDKDMIKFSTSTTPVYTISDNKLNVILKNYSCFNGSQSFFDTPTSINNNTRTYDRSSYYMRLDNGSRLISASSISKITNYNNIIRTGYSPIVDADYDRSSYAPKYPLLRKGIIDFNKGNSSYPYMAFNEDQTTLYGKAVFCLFYNDRRYNLDFSSHIVDIDELSPGTLVACFSDYHPFYNPVETYDINLSDRKKLRSYFSIETWVLEDIPFYNNKAYRDIGTIREGNHNTIFPKLSGTAIMDCKLSNIKGNSFKAAAIGVHSLVDGYSSATYTLDVVDLLNNSIKSHVGYNIGSLYDNNSPTIGSVLFIGGYEINEINGDYYFCSLITKCVDTTTSHGVSFGVHSLFIRKISLSSGTIKDIAVSPHDVKFIGYFTFEFGSNNYFALTNIYYVDYLIDQVIFSYDKYEPYSIPGGYTGYAMEGYRTFIGNASHYYERDYMHRGYYHNIIENYDRNSFTSADNIAVSANHLEKGTNYVKYKNYASFDDKFVYFNKSTDFLEFKNPNPEAPDIISGTPILVNNKMLTTKI